MRKPNKKVLNATEKTVDGIKFRSKLEAYMYGLLKRHSIAHQFEAEHFTLVDKFTFRGEKVKAITYCPDFTGDDFIIECKGHPTPDFKLRLKLFKRYCIDNNESRPYYMPQTEKECSAVARQILERRESSRFNI